MTQLHETLMGRKLIEGTLPDIVNQLTRIADTLEKLQQREGVKKIKKNSIKGIKHTKKEDEYSELLGF